jgi:sugar/nucleoside kinase (ribokinase family)
MDPPGDAEVGSTEQRVPVIAFPKSDRLDPQGAGDAYGDV